MFGGEGAPAGGTLFTIDPATSAFTKLHDFQLTDGGFNWARPIVANDGLLYFAGYAGSNGGGAIFALDPALDTYTELYALDQETDGGAITGRLLQAADEALSGTASQGGSNSQAGTIFRYDPVSDVFTKLHDLDGDAGGRTPYGGLCEADNGWMYGTTYEGGAGERGILYKYHPGTDVFQHVHDFLEEDGVSSWSSLMRLGPDLLIGSVAAGGLNRGGYHYTVVPSTDSVSVVTNFSLLSGSNPVGDLVTAPDGLPYGLLSQGGDAYFGTLVRLDPLTYQPTVLHHFSNGADGGLPRGELAFTGANVGVQERSGAPFFSLAPNPGPGPITLRCAAQQLPAMARITDAQGRTVRELRIVDATTVIDLGGSPGVHCVTLTSAERTLTLRMVVR